MGLRGSRRLKEVLAEFSLLLKAERRLCVQSGTREMVMVAAVVLEIEFGKADVGKESKGLTREAR